MFLFGLGKLVYGKLPAVSIPHPRKKKKKGPKLIALRHARIPVIILIINAIAVLSEDRFLARSTSRHSYPLHLS